MSAHLRTRRSSAGPVLSVTQFNQIHASDAAGQTALESLKDLREDHAQTCAFSLHARTPRL